MFFILLGLSCYQPQYPIYTPPTPRQQEPPPPPKPKVYKKSNVFENSYAAVWSATLQGLKWMKWNPAFAEPEEGLIRLKEAYVYRKTGKLLRIYRWPSQDEMNKSNINDYLAKVSIYTVSGYDVPFSQESMEIRLDKISDNKIRVNIKYNVRPYLGYGKFWDGFKSSQYIESTLLDKIGENLKGRTVAEVQ